MPNLEMAKRIGPLLDFDWRVFYQKTAGGE